MTQDQSGPSATNDAVAPALTSIARALSSIAQPLAGLMNSQRESDSILSDLAPLLQELDQDLSSLLPASDLSSAFGEATADLASTLEAAGNTLSRLANAAEESHDSPANNEPGEATANTGPAQTSDAATLRQTLQDAATMFSGVSSSLSPLLASLQALDSALSESQYSLVAISQAVVAASDELGARLASPREAWQSEASDAALPAPGNDRTATQQLIESLASFLDSGEALVDGLGRAITQLTESMPFEQDGQEQSGPVSRTASHNETHLFPMPQAVVSADDSPDVSDAIQQALSAAWSSGNTIRFPDANDIADGNRIDQAIAELQSLMETLTQELPERLTEALTSLFRTNSVESPATPLTTGRGSEQIPGMPGGYRGLDAVLENTPSSLGVSGIVAASRWPGVQT